MTRTPRRRTGDTAPVPFPVLIADIGGTNARFSILSEAHAPLRAFPLVRTADHPDFTTAATATVLDTTAIMPRALLLALAGPITGPRAKMTNADWVIDPEAIREALNLDTVVLFNDFEALALALPALKDDQLLTIGGGESEAREPRVVLGPGTGLGVAALIYSNRQYTPIAGEGGHVSVGPQSERDFAIWPHLQRHHGRITGEALLSGNGMARIYRAVALADGGDGDWCSHGAEVTLAAAEGDPVAREAVELFLTYLGRLAGDMALVFLAKGGVYIAGGIAPRLIDRFADSGFREAFEAKAPHRAIMTSIPTYVVTEPQPAVAGMASFATLPERFAVDLRGRRFGA
jgi:glucokinase